MRIVATLIAATSLFGCFGRGAASIEGAPSAAVELDAGIESLCAEVTVGPSPLRRLTPEQYADSARDLLALSAVSLALAPAEGAIITELEVDKLSKAAAQLVATGGHERFVPEGCGVTGDHQAATNREAFEACARGFILQFGRNVFRRPLRESPGDDELFALLSRYRAFRDAHLAPDDALTEPFTFRESLAAIAEVMLQSAHHLYLLEEGVADPALPEDVARLSGFERATRLSYFLWGTTPDPGLLEAAERGELDTDEGVRAQAERLLGDPRARGVVRAFASKYLDLDATAQHPRLEELPKSDERFPFDSPQLRAAMRRESEALFERAFFDEGGSFQTLIASNLAYVNADLATLYGLEGGPASSTQFEWMALDSTQRAGLFTRAAFLAKNGDQAYQSPIHRGVNLYRDVLCQELGPPPPNANDVPAHPEIREGEVLTTRRQTELRTSGDECSGCHRLVNPFGFALEHYDAMGQWQDTEPVSLADGGIVEAPIDAIAEILETDMKGVVEGSIALSTRLAASQMAQDCMAQQWFERALARRSIETDACHLTPVQERFRTTNDLRQLVVDVLTSPAMTLLDRSSR